MTSHVYAPRLSYGVLRPRRMRQNLFQVRGRIDGCIGLGHFGSIDDVLGSGFFMSLLLRPRLQWR